MSLPRILVVCRHFWPVVDDDAMALWHWTGALSRRGCTVTVVTPRWHPTWPATSECREVKIHRLLPGPTTNWYSTHYVRNLGKWISQHIDQWDCIYVDGANADLFQVCNRRICGSLPVFCRVSLAASQGNFSVPQPLVDVSRKLFSIVVPDAFTHRALTAAGVSAGKMVRIADVCWSPLHRDNQTLLAARVALTKLSADFMMPLEMKLIVCIGEISRGAGSDSLARAAIALLEEDHSIRVWLVGPDREAKYLYSFLRDHSWHRDIMIFGTFDDVEELVAAADLIVFPNFVDRARFLMPYVVASGTPWIAPSESEWNTRLGGDAELLMWNNDVDDMVQKLREWLTYPPKFEQTASRLSQMFLRSVPTEMILDEWIRLFSQS